jgi:hypothetical protein
LGTVVAPALEAGQDRKTLRPAPAGAFEAAPRRFPRQPEAHAPLGTGEAPRPSALSYLPRQPLDEVIIASLLVLLEPLQKFASCPLLPSKSR